MARNSQAGNCTSTLTKVRLREATGAMGIGIGSTRTRGPEEAAGGMMTGTLRGTSKTSTTRGARGLPTILGKSTSLMTTSTGVAGTSTTETTEEIEETETEAGAETEIETGTMIPGERDMIKYF
jgi:hypothetical protein